MAHPRNLDDDPIVRGIRRTPPLRREDNAALARTVVAGGPDAERARAIMVEGNMRLVLLLARKYPDGTLTLHDRLQEGAIGLMKAVNKFDPDRGISFATYATYWVRATIDRAINSNEYALAVPGNVAVAIRRLRRIEATSPIPLTDDETEEVLDLGAGSVAAVRMLPTSVMSFDAPVSADDADGPTVGDTIADGSADDPEDAALRSGLWRALERCPNLNDRDRTMLSLFALGETYQDMGDLYGVSRERSRQVVASALRALRSSNSGQ
ncbi:MAG: sigma-70 family RNA polymerase sigma factor [Actinobacteria bacterium]|nr:sigma-70 family RNA polymerase sigma factor [Actinomycetota bacterium]